MSSYSKPPITEAIIAISFDDRNQHIDHGKYVSAFSPNYPNNQITKNLDVKINLPENVEAQPGTVVNQQNGVRLSSIDETEIVVMWPNMFLVSQLSPYPGWETFSARALRDWKISKKFGYRKIVNFGLRFINRIDIVCDSEIIEESDFLSFHLKAPNILGPFNTYGSQAVFPVADLKCFLTINSGLIPSPLIGHASIILDLEISRRVDVPQNDDDIFELFALMRLKKNEVFEACITDKARKLFNS